MLKQDVFESYKAYYPITEKNASKLIRETKVRMDHVGNSSENIDEQILARKLKEKFILILAN